MHYVSNIDQDEDRLWIGIVSDGEGGTFSISSVMEFLKEKGITNPNVIDFTSNQLFIDEYYQKNF